MMTASTSLAAIAFDLEQLVQPHGIFVGGAARIGGDAPAGADLAARRPARRRHWCSRHRSRAAWRVPSPKRRQLRVSREADVAGADDLDAAVVEPQPHRAVGLDPVERARRSARPGPLWTSSGVPTGCARASQARANAARLGRPPRRRARARNSPASMGANACGADRVPASATQSCARRSAGAAARLTPNPATTRSPDRSSRMPASLASPIIRSLGHLSCSGAPGAAASTASISASPATSASAGAGGSAVAQLRPASIRGNCPRIDSHARPCRPRPRPGEARPANRLRPTWHRPASALLVEPSRSTMRMRLRRGYPAALSVSWPSGPISR